MVTFYNDCRGCSWTSSRLSLVVNHEDTPAQLSLQFAIAGLNQYRGRVGKNTTNLFNVWRSDLKERGVKLPSDKDLVRLREMATDRTRCSGLWGD